MPSPSPRSKGGRLAVCLALCLGLASAAQAFDRLEFTVQGGDKALEKSLRAASLLVEAQSSGRGAAQDLFADARADYAALLNALYAQGHYAGVIHITLDGTEAAAIAPLDAPDRIDRITVQIDPGPVFAFATPRMQPLAPGTTLPSGFAIGHRADSGIILDSVAAGVAGWRAQGHAKATVSGQSLTADHRKQTLAVDIALQPGPRLRFGPLILTGQDRMRPDRIRAIAGLPEGQVFSPEALDLAAARLRRSGVFKSVTLTEADQITRPDVLPITAALVEDKLRRYSFGAEVASSEGLALTGSWLHRNLLGGGERLTISGSVTNIAAQGGGADYALGATLDRPATFTPDTVLSFGIGVKRLNETAYSADTFAVSSTLTHVLSDRVTLKGGFSFDYTSVTNPSPTQVYRALSLPLGLIWDKRDSKTDATRGLYMAAEAKPFLGFGITDSGVRLALDGRAYRGLGQRMVLAGRLQAGAVLGTSLQGTPRDYLFSAGGGGTVRGFPYQSLGVNVLLDSLSQPYQTGGTYFLGGTLETRLRVSDKIGAVGFIDFAQVDVQGFFNDPDNWQAGAGLGLRYATPVGPIRLDLAVPVGGLGGDGLQIYVGLGQAF